mmetsp:Transcript_9133/g.14086  ORF Transcript_9133/g.14086 Transcript_9133/m.14086 type:complete len:159 (-) Transcript_9133:761-1237(-)
MLNASQDKTKHGIYFIFSVLALPLLHSLHSLHSSLPRYLTKTLLYTKQPTQKPAALSNQVNKLQVSAIAATAALKSFSLISSLNWTMMKQDRASINPTHQAKRLGLAGFQRGEGCKTTATRVAIIPRGAKGVNPNNMLVTNSHETMPKMTFTRRRFLI